MSHRTAEFTTFASTHPLISIKMSKTFVYCFFSRFLSSKPQTPSPKPNSLSGPEDQQSPRAKQALSSPADWSSFLCAAMKEEKLKSDSSCLAMTEGEQGELYETIRHAVHSLRKHKVCMVSTHTHFENTQICINTHKGR